MIALAQTLLLFGFIGLVGCCGYVALWVLEYVLSAIYWKDSDYDHSDGFYRGKP